jgi:hypothetical protein
MFGPRALVHLLAREAQAVVADFDFALCERPESRSGSV